MFSCGQRWILAVSGDKVPQWAASRNLITHSTGRTSPQPCTKPGRWNTTSSYRWSLEYLIYSMAFILHWSYQSFCWCNVQWRLCNDWLCYRRIAQHLSQIQPKPSGWMWRRGWGGCRSVYTEAFCWINANVTPLHDISIPCRKHREMSLELNSSMQQDSERVNDWIKKWITLALPKDAEDEDCYTERANGHAIPNSVYQLHHGKVLSLPQ